MHETKLAMRLQSSEPKCANCKWWDTLNRYDPSSPDGPGIPYPVGRCKYVTQGSWPILTEYFTADLSVCSKWEAKD